LGHIISADTTVPMHTCAEHLHYFELVARTFDLVIVDECDESQKMLDDHGALTLKLTGDAQSIHIKLQQTVSLLAANRRWISDGVLRYIQRANEFERHTLRFIDEIRRLQKMRPDLAYQYSEKLLTASFLLREAIEEAGRKETFSAEAQSALSDLWETAMYRAFFERDEEEEEGWRKAPRYAPALGLSPEDGDTVWKALNRALKRYLTLDYAALSEKPIKKVVTILTELIRSPSAESITSQVRLLIAVGFTIASYQRLAKDARPLARRRELREASDLVFSKASVEMREVVPRSILGTFSSVRYRQAAGMGGVEIDYLVMDSTPRLLLHRLHEVGGVNVLLASATSWLEPASQYHVGKPPDIVLSSRTPQLGPLRLYFQPKSHPVTKEPLRFSGSGYEREDNLRHIVTALAALGPGGSSDLERTVRGIRTELGKPRKAALIVNSYEQVRLVVEQIRSVNPDLADRTRGVLRELSDHSRKHYVLRGQVEALGPDPNVDILVFPLGALGRGTNIVFAASDADGGKAAIGSVFFLTRPHPAAGDLSLMLSLLARQTECLDAEDMRALGLSEVRALFDQRRYAVFRQIARLLARPMSASQLDDETLPVFAANLLVGVLQTIGRGMRMRMPVEVYFVDAAWAPKSAEGQPDTKRSSMLVAMRDVLTTYLSTRDPDQHAIYEALYKDFAKAFRDIDGVIFPGGSMDEDVEAFRPSPAGLEDAMDGWEPEDYIEVDDVEDEENEMDPEEAA
jgi:hypothetical protein